MNPPHDRARQEHVEELDVQEFGRNAVSTAKQVLVQRVREAEATAQIVKVFSGALSDRIGRRPITFQIWTGLPGPSSITANSGC